MGDVDAETRRLARVLDHPVRARIIELLGGQGPLGWKALSLELGVKTGALYHHLDALEGLVERDSSKKYSLTKSGRVVYARVSQSHTIESLHKAALDLREAGRAQRVMGSVFAPRSVLTWLTSTAARAGMTSVALAVALTAFVVLIGSAPRLYSLQPGGGPVLVATSMLGSLAVLVAASYASTALIFKSRADLLSLAAASVFSFLPVIAFSGVALLSPLSALFASSRVAYTLCLVVFQTWSAVLLGAGISVASGIRIEKSLLVSLVVLYATMVLLFV